MSMPKESTLDTRIEIDSIFWNEEYGEYHYLLDRVGNIWTVVPVNDMNGPSWNIFPTQEDVYEFEMEWYRRYT
mgnify:FL=1